MNDTSTLQDRSAANRTAAGETIGIAMRAAQAHELSNRSILLSLWTTAVSTLIEASDDAAAAAETLMVKASGIKGDGRNADAPLLRIDTVTTQRRVAEAEEAAKLIGGYLADFLVHLRAQDREDEFPDAVVDSTFTLLANIWGPKHLRRAIAAQVQALGDGLELPIFPQEPSVSNLEPNQVALRPPVRESWRAQAPVPAASPPARDEVPPPHEDGPTLDDADDEAPPPVPEDEDAPEFVDEGFETRSFDDGDDESFPAPNDEPEEAPSTSLTGHGGPVVDHGLPPLADDHALSTLEALLDDEPAPTVEPPPMSRAVAPVPADGGFDEETDDVAASVLDGLLDDEPDTPTTTVLPPPTKSGRVPSSEDEDDLLSIMDVPAPPPVPVLDDMPAEMPMPPPLVEGRRAYMSAEEIASDDDAHLAWPAPEDDRTTPYASGEDGDEPVPPEGDDAHVPPAPEAASLTTNFDAALLDAHDAPDRPDDRPETVIPTLLATAAVAAVVVGAEVTKDVEDAPVRPRAPVIAKPGPSAREIPHPDHQTVRLPTPLPGPTVTEVTSMAPVSSGPARTVSPAATVAERSHDVRASTTVAMPSPVRPPVPGVTMAPAAVPDLYSAHAKGEADRWIDCCLGVEPADSGRDSVFAAIVTILSADGASRERREMSGRLLGVNGRKATLRACKEVLLRIGPAAEGETLQVSTSADALLRGMLDPASRLRTPAEAALWDDIDVLCGARTVEWVQRRPGMGSGAAEQCDRLIRTFVTA